MTVPRAEDPHDSALLSRNDARVWRNTVSDVRYPIGTLEEFAATVGGDRRECLRLMTLAPRLLTEAVQA